MHICTSVHLSSMLKWFQLAQTEHQQSVSHTMMRSLQQWTSLYICLYTAITIQIQRPQCFFAFTQRFILHKNENSMHSNTAIKYSAQVLAGTIENRRN